MFAAVGLNPDNLPSGGEGAFIVIIVIVAMVVAFILKREDE